METRAEREDVMGMGKEMGVVWKWDTCEKWMWELGEDGKSMIGWVGDGNRVCEDWEWWRWGQFLSVCTSLLSKSALLMTSYNKGHD